ncbi:alpha,alpha-trehalose-phosphate synthase (UDP-forming) [Sinorhizobium sp. RAC02]|uniref:alpha,alpha-trehalose-phosphate synthase (UDP-forming) n=1 Tax=Sinorhizobium sp. RAC02 TaxID=1842534 RepID=UPI00083E6CF7|nr:alpha,alpha-trehalose-phosphate synthase (UDP-forming) [Sinorhizobium sp. RAC02]AOF93065.1 alpha,alpha-trehalose-phosphate synthase [Sinorhizobium sp. RAC02]
MSRLIVVSNRVPVPDKRGAAPAGGLAVALQSALKTRGGLWLGWSGQSCAEDAVGPLRTMKDGNIEYALTDLTERDVEEYYQGFANRVLWPICHYRLDLAEYGRREMTGYFRVNRFFASRLLPLIEEDDLIWIHDYHLIPLAAELRRLGVKNRIGFFLHIPWPSPDVFLTMPVHDELLNGLTAYDVIGFQTDHDRENFAGCLARLGIGDRLDTTRFVVGERTFTTKSYPIGIETAEFASLAKRASETTLHKRMLQSLDGKELIIGVDRLDYSKGITQRIDAFETFLTRHEDSQRKVTLLQITPKSRSEVPEYEAMQRAVAEQAGRVNGALGTVDWVPIRYVNRSLRRPALAGLYRMAKLALVTPLRDGMNLVAKEYVAAQSEDDPGVLLLSRFAGAAQELKDAVLVNPYDVEGTAEAIARSLVMPLQERRERWESMMTVLRANDVFTWCDTFLEDLAEGATKQSSSVPAEARSRNTA